MIGCKLIVESWRGHKRFSFRVRDVRRPFQYNLTLSRYIPTKRGIVS